VDSDTLIANAQSLRERIQLYARIDPGAGNSSDGAKAQVCEFLGQYAGARSAFTRQAGTVVGHNRHVVGTLTAILNSYVEYLQAGLASDLSPERKAELDVVSDILDQAQRLLENKAYHPAAAAVLIGAALEEFLRTWVEHAGIGGKGKPGIDAYSGTLRAAELITKQDAKDISSWAGIRNHAAHGEWGEASDRQRIGLMLEGVNLFMRQNRGR
jgi:hypothetical protein